MTRAQRITRAVLAVATAVDLALDAVQRHTRADPTMGMFADPIRNALVAVAERLAVLAKDLDKIMQSAPITSRGGKSNRPSPRASKPARRWKGWGWPLSRYGKAKRVRKSCERTLRRLSRRV